MPGGDRTGPLGQGPMTGRGAGFCGGNAAPGNANAGRGGGRGGGFRRWFFATGLPGWMRFGSADPGGAPGYSREDEMRTLRSQSEYLSKALEDINMRLSEIEKKESR